MGYAVYDHQDPNRANQFAGYGVPAYCDYPGCETEIDRGFGYSCGQVGPLDTGCGGYYCGQHQNYDFTDDSMSGGRIKCLHGPEDRDWSKPEHPEWIAHVETDASWSKFRVKNPGWKEQWTK